ncbi:MAG TPA: hypothetical protein VFD92_22075 [Candidatus Binatia bacterium]|nr:hypothetical protein [Candidatus Binatia bacterium]
MRALPILASNRHLEDASIAVTMGGSTVRVRYWLRAVVAALALVALAGSAGAVCVPSSTTLCLLNNRFAARLQWNDGGPAGLRDAFVAAPQTDGSASASGIFYFFAGDPNNWEVLVKMLNACANNPARYWVLVSASTGFQFALTITDTVTGAAETFGKPLNGQAGGIADFDTFPGSCTPISSAQVRYLNDLLCFSAPFTSSLSANGFQWSSFSGTASPYQSVNRTSLGPFAEINDSVCANAAYPGTFTVSSGRRYALVQTIQNGNRILGLLDEGAAEVVGDPHAGAGLVQSLPADKSDDRLSVCD